MILLSDKHVNTCAYLAINSSVLGQKHLLPGSRKSAPAVVVQFVHSEFVIQEGEAEFAADEQHPQHF